MEFKFAPGTIAPAKAGTSAARAGRMVGGWLSTFGPPMDSYGDIVHENAFDRHLAERGDRLVGLSAHDPGQVIGWHQLKKVPGKGLWTDFTFLEGIARADEDLIRVKSGAMAFSIGYFTLREEYRRQERWLLDVDLMEGSVVAFGANRNATIEERSEDAAVLALLRNLRSLNAEARANQSR
jgi:HK97 family phage prohead protease